MKSAPTQNLLVRAFNFHKKWILSIFQMGPLFIFHILPSRHTQGFQLKLPKRLIQITFSLIGLLFSYLVITSSFALKYEYQLQNLQTQNSQLSTLITDYENNLSDFSVAIAPQLTYVGNQLGSWQSFRQQNSFATGGAGGTGGKGSTGSAGGTGGVGGGQLSSWDDSQNLARYKKILAEKQKLLLETSNIGAILENDFVTLKQNHLIMKDLYHEIAEHKQFLSAIPFNWPVLGGWGEIVPSSQLKNRSSKKPNANPFYATYDDTKLLLKLLPGTPILTTANGTVDSITYRYDNPLAVNIVIKHDYNIETIYEGVISPTVQKDDVVKKQQTLGIAMNMLTYKIKLASSLVPPEEYAFLRY